MPDDIPFLPPGPLQLGPLQVQVVGPIGRVGDGLVYHARHGFQPMRLREHAPFGLVRRVEDGTLAPADPSFASAWSDGAGRFLALAEQLRAFSPGGAVQPVLAAAPHPAGSEAGAYLLTPPILETLETALAGGLALTSEEIVLLARRLAAALAEVHARGVVHLDICPATVALSADALQLSDFAVDHRAAMRLLQSDEGLVRPGYAPLELYDAAGTEPLGPPTDIYAAAALLYRLILGAPPAPSPERFRHPAEPRLDALTGYPAALIEAIRRGLAIEPEQRFASGEAWLEAIGGDAHQAVAPAAAEPAPAAFPPIPQGPQLPPFEEPEPRRRRSARRVLVPLLLFAMLAAGLLAFAFAQGWFDSGDEEQAPPSIARFVPPTRYTLGTSVADALGPGDRRWESGRYEDVYTFAGRAGQWVAIDFAARAFPPRLTITGPNGFSRTLDPSVGNTNVLLLPSNGAFNVAVTTEGQGEGPYTLTIRETRDPRPPEPPPEEPAPQPQPEAEAEPAEPAEPRPAPSLAGTWRSAGDPDCRRPARNQLSVPRVGARFTSTVSGTTFVHEILRVDGRRIETILRNTRLAGRRFVFQLSESGASYAIEGETWTRCSGG